MKPYPLSEADLSSAWLQTGRLTQESQVVVACHDLAWTLAWTLMEELQDLQSPTQSLRLLF